MKKSIFILLLLAQFGCGENKKAESDTKSEVELTQCDCNNPSIKEYHELTNQAELSLCKGEYVEASNYYLQAFKKIEKPFGHDVFNASICNQLANRLIDRNSNLQLLINNSEDISKVKSTFVGTYISEDEWDALIVNSTVAYDSKLRKEVDEIFERDQLFRPMYDTHNDTINANRIINMNRIISLTDSIGFPSQIELGYTKSLRGQNHYIVLHHNAQKRSGDKNVLDLEPLLCKAVDEGRFDPEKAIFYLNFQNDVDKKNFEVYSTWQYKQPLLPDSLNNKIWLPDLTTEAVKNANKVRSKWNADKLEQIAIKSDFLTKSDFPFIFTSVMRSTGNMPSDLSIEEAIEQYKMMTERKIEYK